MLTTADVNLTFKQDKTVFKQLFNHIGLTLAKRYLSPFLWQSGPEDNGTPVWLLSNPMC
jgi:hypothetical protein